MPSLRRRIVDGLAPRVGYRYIRLLRSTMRLRYRREERLESLRVSHGRMILAFWHSRFVMLPFAYHGGTAVILHSQHQDSRLLGQLMTRFGFEQAWGSTTRGGASGARALLRRMRDGRDVGITPDGPRGPRRRVQPGVIALGRLSGKPILPLTFAARPAWRARSWDRTLLPLPFSRGLYVYGAPLIVPRDADEAEQERLRLELELELDRITDEADREVGLPLEAPRPEVETR